MRVIPSAFVLHKRDLQRQNSKSHFQHQMTKVCYLTQRCCGKANNLSFISYLGDFTIGNLQLTFPASGGSQTLCSSVSIINDDRLEDEELFCLTLNTPDLGVVAGTNAVTCIVVEDISSKYISNQLSGSLSLSLVFYRRNCGI